MTFLLAVSAAAEVTMVETEVVLDVDYQDFDEEDQIIVTETVKVTLQNLNNSNDATVQVSLAGLPSGYSYGGTQSVVVPANAGSGAIPAKEVTFNLNVTHSKAPGKASVGTIEVRSADGTQVLDTASLAQNTSFMLNFKEIEVRYVDEEGKGQTDTFKTSTDADLTLDEHVRPGSEIRLAFEIENRFTDEEYENSEIESIELKIESDNNDILPDDFEEDYDLDDLKADEEQTLHVEFEIPFDADAGDYDLEITLTGEDGKGIEYEVVKELHLSLERTDDDVRITKATLSPATVQLCPNPRFTIDVEIRNLGTDDQEEVALAVFNTELGINQNLPNLALGEFDEDDDTFSRTFTFTLPANTRAATYPIDITSYINNDDQSDFERLNLVVERCPSPAAQPPVAAEEEDEEDTEETEEEPAVTTTILDTTTPPPASPGQQVSAGTVVKTVEQGYESEDFLVGALIVLIVLIFALVILLAVVFFR